MSKNLTDHEVFWLARHAHNVLAPLIAEGKAVDPSYSMVIEMNFADENGPFHKFAHVNVNVYSAPETCRMLHSCRRSKEDIDALVPEIKADIENLRAGVLADAVMAVL